MAIYNIRGVSWGRQGSGRGVSNPVSAAPAAQRCSVQSKSEKRTRSARARARDTVVPIVEGLALDPRINTFLTVN